MSCSRPTLRAGFAVEQLRSAGAAAAENRIRAEGAAENISLYCPALLF
jgi:hypothetical protein